MWYPLTLGGKKLSPTTGVLFGIGTSASQKIMATANSRALQFYLTFTGTGDNRGLYMQTVFGAASGGESARFYSLARGAVGTFHGVHATAQIDATGSVSGECAGVRATAATLAGLTLSAGTIASLIVDSDLASDVASMTKASFLRFADNGAQKMPLFADFAGFTTADNTTALLRYKAGGYTIACKGGLKITTPDGTFWIPYGTLS